jgi:3-isopropylmalate dehydratase/3-isopropylmalate/(R)-2-methylmalate dehydratase small subunit
MKPFTTLTGVAAPLPIANLDTDQIIPKQFLTTVERTGLRAGLFFDMRCEADGAAKPEFVLNQPAYAGAQVLIAGPNFGCGSSREHAPWALLDFGFRCVIAESFADIFAGNCLNNGILLVRLPAEAVAQLQDEAKGGNHVFTVDLESQTVTSPSGAVFGFEIDPGQKQKLLQGLDDIGQTLTRNADIEAFEYRRKLAAPWLP